MNKFVGAHVSSSGGVFNAPLNAKKIGAKAFALFTKNQRQWNTKPLTRSAIINFQENLKVANINPDHVLPHDSYLINLGSPDNSKWEKSLNSFIDEVNRVQQLGLNKLNFHVGSHLKKISEVESLNRVITALNTTLLKTEKVTLVIENSAGQGSNLGYSFEHLAYIIDKIEDKNRIGVCLDTCHLFGAGYDIRTFETYQNTMVQFDKIIGFKYLKGLHLNDSKAKLGSRVDRHQNIGKGEIGINAFKFIMQDDRFNNIPLILETIDSTLWEQEIKLLYSFEKENYEK